ncbi:acetolactate synthase-1/2/3 large subunit [Amycolatopsis sulphurea]|uniref:Acetolactate synthase-1/2/3 large subunit n=1 Tax=Amycolatopsis sulphurea TaxID=76022 RepID=A0A2A9G1N6_9PSEU|nr:thiamine pyrophosphate-binding protein [Amycolatopsis sulphurea]PFG57564.1 acetolactate synthase-1/2/3 large subunit [Amycolatopsis sulphurea]
MPKPSSPPTVAQAVAAFLAQAGVRRVYGLTGSHIKPIWEAVTHAGLQVVDVRHEAAAVHMAQAEADLTGRLAVATVTTGPGLTNAVTGIAAAGYARSPILVLSAVPPSDQLGLGALEELDQAELVRPLTRFARTVRHDRQVLPFLHAAVAAALGEDGPAGPSYLDFPVDVLRGAARWYRPDEPTRARNAAGPVNPDHGALHAAAAAIRESRRPIVISGRGAAEHPPALVDFLDATGALYLDTPESRGLVPPTHAGYVPAVRSAAMAQADTVITIGRRLDFSLGYGSPAVFRSARTFVRIGRTFEELTENRAPDIEVKGDPGRVLPALTGLDVTPHDPDTEWHSQLRADDHRRRDDWAGKARATPYGPDGRIHPNAMLEVLNRTLDDPSALLIADGGDILSFARVGLRPPARLDTGTFGSLGVGVPFAVAASLIHPGRRVVAVIGDGAFGFNALELDTARRSGAQPVFIIANNQAWNIERLDHVENYASNPHFNTELPGCRYDRLADALGLHAQHVTRIEDLAPAIRLALANAPALIDVQTSGEVPSPDFRAGLADLPDLHVLRGWDEAERGGLG